MKLDRRQFVRGSAASIFLLNAPAARPRIRRRSPNEELRIAVAGLNGRGRHHVEAFHRLADVRVVALCDVDETILAREGQKFRDREEKVGTYIDLRHVLERDDVDAVAIATPNHWHSLQSIWACQAGKDVYVEKPVSHNVWEGRRLVQAARKYDRIVQAGTQSRSSQAITEAIGWLHEGHLGSIRLARGLCYKPRKSIGKVEEAQHVPETLDYDLWTGPAPLKPLERTRLHYDWHWVFDTGNGDVGNQGVHQMDIARWALGEPALAPRVLSLGGRFGYDDDGNTPNTLVTLLEYERAPLIFEVRGLPQNKAAQEEDWGGSMDEILGMRIGVAVYCTNGTLCFPSYSVAIAYDQDGQEIRRWEGAQDHFANFVAAVRSRDRSVLTADIEEGHVSSALCHLGNISYGRGLRAEPKAIGTALKDEPELAEAYERLRAHLVSNDVDVKETRIKLGAWLDVSPAEERITNDELANALLTREYREPFTVPAEG